MEDLLDTWAGTLLVVSHDRYFMERVTDQQYAILSGHLRHLPGGVDEYLTLQSAVQRARPANKPTDERSASTTVADGMSGAERRAVAKEVAAIERRLDKLAETVTRMHADMATHDPSDYEGLQQRTEQVTALEADIEALEHRWLELSDRLG